MSARMFGSDNPMFRNAKLTAVCRFCGKEFKYYKNTSTGKYCSQKCSHRDPLRRTTMGMSKRGIKMSTLARHRMSIAGKGRPKPDGFGNKVKQGLKKHWDNKGRKSSIYKLTKSSPEYDLWLKTVYSRSNGICEKCGVKPPKLDAHHVIPFSVLIAEVKLGLVDANSIHDPNNGIAICRQCHKELHKNGTRFHQLLEGRLFLAIKKLWHTSGEPGTFSDFYVCETDKMINQIKNKLPAIMP